MQAESNAVSQAIPAHPSRGADDLVALAALIFGAVVIGFAAILVRFADAGPAASAFWRLVFALPLLAAMAARTPVSEIGRGGSMKFAALAGLLFVGDLVCWHYSIMHTSVANATVLSNLSPLVVAALAWAFLADRPTPLFAIGMGMAIAGAGGVALFADKEASGSSFLGDGFAAATAVWYGFYILSVNIARRGLPAPVVMLISTVVGIPLLLAIALLLGERVLPASLGGWAACVGLGLVHVFGQGAIAWALGRLSAALTSVVILIQPVVAAIAGVFLLDEALTVLQVAAAFVTLIGVVLARNARQPAAEEQA